MKEIEPMVKDVKSILRERNVEQVYRPFYNDRRKNGRRIKMPFLLDADTSQYLQKELQRRFPAHDICVRVHKWETHWQFYARTGPVEVTTVHVKNK
jgi:hypothetical protein